jgi:Dolichyl-phosphate-mannose-protein mannosyltransferase
VAKGSTPGSTSTASSASPSGSPASSGTISLAGSTAQALRTRTSRRWALLGAVGAGAFLLARLAPDIHGKPLFEDEAVAGLIGARPPWEIVVTTLWDRGGAPLHFLLVHVAFAFDSSPEALRWLSVVFALATVAVCYDLGRRADGHVAGATASIVAACSGMLAVYGSFGRMYALFAFAAALAADLFVRARDLRTREAALWAAGAAWLLPAVHPYGGIVVAVEAVIALVLWRGRPLRPALPVLLVGLAFVPFLVADLRLANRFEVSSGSTHQLATRHEAWNQFTDALRGFAGGSGWTFVLFFVLGAVGAALLARRRASFVAWGLVALVLPPLVSTLVHTGRAPDLSPRHLIFALPFWAVFIGVAVARIPFSALAVVAIAILAAVAPQGIHDPRSITYTANLGTEEALAAPSQWLRARITSVDLLYPYSSVFLAALPEAGEATSLPRAQTTTLLDSLRRIDYPAARVFVAVPIGTTGVSPVPLRGYTVGRFPRWLLVEVRGEFNDSAAVLRSTEKALAASRDALRPPIPSALAGWFDLNLEVLCKSLRELGSECAR